MATQIAREDAGIVPAFAHRTEPYEWWGYKADGVTPIAINEQDVIRFKLAATEDGLPVLDLTETATDNGSRVVIDTIGEEGVTPVSGRVIFGQADTIGFSGEYFFELLLVDSGEDEPENAIKLICYGKMIFKKTIGGDVGLA